MGYFTLVVGAIDTEVGPTWMTRLADSTVAADKIAALDYVINPYPANPFAGLKSDALLVGPDDIIDFTWEGIPDGAVWYLDGNTTPYEFSGLPSGFIVTGARVMSNVLVTNTCDISPSDFVHATWNGSNGPNRGGTGPELDYDILTNNPFVSTLDIGTTKFGIVARMTMPTDCISGLNTINMDLLSLRIEGTYEIFSGQFTVETPIVTIGNNVIISSPEGALEGIIPDGGEDDLDTDDGSNNDGKSGINLQYMQGGVLKTFNIPTTSIIYKSRYRWIFWIPVYFDFEGEVTILGTGNGIQFSGSVPLGTLEVLLYGNVSGIYRITPNKTTDSIYRHDGTVTEIKIPNPFAKPGFVGN